MGSFYVNVLIGRRRAKETGVVVRKDGTRINMLRLQDHSPVQIRGQVHKDAQWYYRRLWFRRSVLIDEAKL